MRRILLTMAGTAAMGAIVFAQEPPRRPARMPGVGPARVEVIGFGPIAPGEPVIGVPFTAEATTEMTHALPDGNRVEHRSTSTIARDSRGRVRREQPLPPLGPMAAAPDLVMITIIDPAQHVQYLLDPARKSAMRVDMPRLPGTSAPPGVAPPNARGSRRPQLQTEHLGTKTVVGIAVEGTRTTMTIPAGSFGNANAIDVVTERWFSPELRIILSSRRSDPLMGDVVFDVVNVIRGEPAREMFEIPADYTVTQSRPARPD